MAVPTYQNYMIYFSNVSGDQKFWVALHPLTETKHEFLDALLNGLEIFKIVKLQETWQASIHNLLYIKL